MKKLPFLSLMLLLVPVFAFAQHINGIPLDSIESPYLRVTAYTMPGTSTTVLLDYGQPITVERNAVLKDKDDSLMRFNGMVDAINYLHAFGYELDEVFVTGETGGNIIYILKKMDSE